MNQELIELGIDEVVPDPSQPRTSFPPEEIERLAASIAGRGMQLPLRVRRDDERGCWVIVSGERRWRAARQAGRKTVSCLLVAGEISEADILADQLIENNVRQDLRPLELARSIAKLKALKGWNSSTLAAKTGITGVAVTRAEALLTLPPDIQALVEDGRVPESAAYELSRLPDEQSQRELASVVAAGKIGRDAVAQIVRDRVGRRKSTRKATRLSMQPGDGVSVSVAAETLKWDGLLAALDRIRKEAKKLYENGKPVGDLAKALKG
jgi:ParB family chromosome partitioning protein